MFAGYPRQLYSTSTTRLVTVYEIYVQFYLISYIILLDQAPNITLQVRQILQLEIESIVSQEELSLITHSLIHHFETVPNSKKLQTTKEILPLQDFKIQIA